MYSDDELAFEQKEVNNQVWKCCANCDYGRNKCHPCLKWNCEVPFEIQPIGCKAWIGLLPF
jgi:hypothetical protein